MTGSPEEARLAHSAHGSAVEHVPAMPPVAQEFQGLHAGVVSRVAASTIDFMLLVAVLVGCYLGVAAFVFLWNTRTFHFWEPSWIVVLAVGGFLLMVYLTVCWVLTGRTYGDHVMALRVVDHRGKRLSIGLAALRALLCVLVPIGLFWAAVNRKNHSLADIAFRTNVVYAWPTAHQLHTG